MFLPFFAAKYSFLFRETNPRSAKVRGFKSTGTAVMIWQRDADRAQHFFVVESQNGSYLEGQVFMVCSTFPMFISLPTETQKICVFTCHSESP